MVKDSLRSSSALLARVAGAVAVILALVEVLIDWVTHIDLNVSILYGLPLVVAAATRSRRLLWALALFLLVTTFAIYSVQIPPGVFSPHERHFVDRVLAGAALALTAGLVHVGMLGLDLLDAQRSALRAQNEELERRRRDAEEASSRKTRLLASVSHDIRTPINAINLMAECLCRTAGKDKMAIQVPDIAHRLQANALALADLVGDVLDLARLDAVGAELHLSEFCLDDLLAEECARVSPLAQAKNLWLKIEPPETPVRLRSDRVKLARVVGNLLGNAIKYTFTGGVTVTAALGPDRAALVRVCDTGVGIPQQQLGHIFDEFVQLGNPECDRSKGYGLGLAICRKLVQALGGNISAESQPGRGSVFTVRLTSSCVMEASGGTGPTEGQPRRAGTAGARLAGLRILLVEDNHSTREGTAQVLRGEGAVVCEAADGATARRLLREEAWGAVLLDMMLSDFDGREILKDLATRRPPSLGAVLVTTADLTTERRREVQQLGAEGFLGKPTDVARLIGLLEERAAGCRQR
jgi:signal transduction histidine kinase/ActR/RegA family two-component response regulator